MNPARLISSGSLLAVLISGCAQTTPGSADDPAASAASRPVPAAASRQDCRRWQPLDSGTTASFRGLSAVSHEVAWVSGTGGTWGRTTDGGDTWTMRTVPGAEELDFRDVDAFDQHTAYLMSAGPGELSMVFKTVDGGESWELLLTNTATAGFFDGMALWDAQRGLLYGDPVEGRFVVLATADGGATWEPPESMPPALRGEAGFAASGSGIAVAAGGHAWFGTGGPRPRVFRSSDHGRTWQATETEMRAGADASGIFSLAFHDPQRGVAVGGNYIELRSDRANAALTTDGGVAWNQVEAAPSGYRSAVAYAPGTQGRVLIAVGTSGSDLSLDGGESWVAIGRGAYNSISFGGSACAGWAAGPDGRLARLAKPETAAP